MIASVKTILKKKPKNKQTKIDRQNLGTNGKTKLYRQNHRKKHTHTHTKREKGKNIYISVYIKEKEESN